VFIEIGLHSTGEECSSEAVKGKRSTKPRKRKHSEVQKRIRNLRSSQGISQADLARTLGKSISLVSKWENGYAHPKLVELGQLANALHCSVQFLVTGNEDSVYAEAA
jgi:ribosome-binding protein aMBF1 (putative translation factor)